MSVLGIREKRGVKVTTCRVKGRPCRKIRKRMMNGRVCIA